MARAVSSFSARFLGAAAALIPVTASAQSPIPPITISPIVPTELNPPFVQGANGSGGAPNATPEQAAAFSWQEFIALNWPAGPQHGQPNQRDTAAANCRFSDPKCSGPTVWQTFRGKVEIFPGQGDPPGYPGVTPNDPSFGYDLPPKYVYAYAVNACDSAQANDPAPWINLDETDQITLDLMFAGAAEDAKSPGNSSPQLIRFLAKANRAEYVYVAKNCWWSAVPTSVVDDTENYLKTNMKSPPSDSSQFVSLPDASIEIKSAWRPLTASEIASGRFHTQVVRFYEHVPGGNDHANCFRDERWGLVALHIIQKTPSAPYFIYATFEQTDNLLTANGGRVEDDDGNVRKPAPSTATTPQVCLQDDQPKAGQPVQARVIPTPDPTTCRPITGQPVYCTSPGKRLYYRNANNNSPGPAPAPSDGNICVNKRDNEIPQYAIDGNKHAHSEIANYLRQNGITSSPWLHYKLVNVQYYPYDKILPKVPTPNGSLYSSRPPYTAKNPASSSFYQANIVVETNRALQLFSGGLTLDGMGVSTDWNAGTANMAGTPHKNTYYNGSFVNAGGCLGCHGSQGQNPHGQAGDFSVILARGSVKEPEHPSQLTSQGLSEVPRNRSLRPQNQ